VGPFTAAQWKDELIASVVVCFAMVPESVAFAHLAHCEPDVGIHAAGIAGLVCALFGGRPGMMNGPSGAVAAVASHYVAVANIGVEVLFVSVIVAGVLMTVAAAVQGDRLFSVVPVTVIIGFCNGLAIVIGCAQADWFRDAEGDWLKGRELWYTLEHTAVAFAIVLLFPRLTRKIPASLLAIAVGCVLERYLIRDYLGGRTATIGDTSPIKPSHTWPRPFFWNSGYDVRNIDVRSIGSCWTIAAHSCTLALVAMLESLMTLELLNQETGTSGEPNRQVWALGAANVLAGLLGTMGGSSLIDLSVMNSRAGGKLRASAVFVSIGTFLCIITASPVLNTVPVGTLAGIMLLVVVNMAKWFAIPVTLVALLPRSYLSRGGPSPWRSWLRRMAIHRYDAFVITLVTAATAWMNLAVAAFLGLFFVNMRFVWEARDCLEIKVEDAERYATRTYALMGPLTFVARDQVLATFQVETDPRDVRIDFRECCVLDSSSLMLLQPILERYAQRGVQVELLSVPERHLPYLSRFVLPVQ
jgi:SulP family sulfate permease